MNCDMRVSIISLVVLVTTKLSVSHNCELRHAEAEEEDLKVRNKTFNKHFLLNVKNVRLLNMKPEL